MDGTLWDSAKAVADCWTETVKSEYPVKGVIPPVITEEKIKSVMGLTMDKLAKQVFPELDEKDREVLLQKCGEKENDYLRENGGILYPEVEATLIRLKDKYHLYIVSNCQSGYIEAFLEYYGFGKYFDDIECYGNNNMKKGDNIRLLADRNCLDTAVYVGDIQGDYVASREAGVDFIHAAYGFGAMEQKVPYINKFSDLYDVMEELYDL